MRVSIDVSDPEIATLRQSHAGQRLFVIGNGRSLDDTPLHLLGRESTFCGDRFHLLLDRIRWRPTFYTTVDPGVATELIVEIGALAGTQLFLPETLRGALPDADGALWYRSLLHDADLAGEATLGVTAFGCTTAAAIQLALHLGFGPIYLLGCDRSEAGPDAEAMSHGLELCRDIAGERGQEILDATVRDQTDIFDRVDIRSLFTRTSPRRHRPAPAPGTEQGVPVAQHDHVSATALVGSVIGLEQPGMVLDIGAGTGSDLAVFAAAGWEVRAFEPDPDAYDRLVGTLPPAWPVFVDPRAVGRAETTAPIFPLQSGGTSLVPRSDGATASGIARVVTPALALSQVNGRAPDVVVVSACGWEHEILQAYPWASASPRAVIVDVNDSYTPRFGFRGRDVATLLEAHGYDVFALRHLRTTPSHAVQRAGSATDDAGELIQLIALAAGTATVDSMEQCRRAMLADLRDRSARAELQPPPPATADERRKLETQVRTLRHELDSVHASTSWRVGHRLVVLTKRVTKPLRIMARVRDRVGSRVTTPAERTP